MPALPHNLEKHPLRRGEYRAYDAAGYPWRVRKSGTGGWEAVPGNAHPGKFTATRITERLLAEVASTLAARTQPAPVEPF